MSAPRPMPLEARGYESLGALIRDALVQFKTTTALIEKNRKRESARLTYLDFKRAALPIARRLQDAGVGADGRVAIVMSNQSKWLIGAYAVFYRGAVLVPLDYKLPAPEQQALMAHCGPKALIVEYPMFRRFDLATLDVPTVIVTEAPEGADLGAALRWEDLQAAGAGAPEPTWVPRTRADLATIVYSSGTGGRAKGCMLTHDAYLEQLRALMALFPMAVGDRYFSILPTNHAIDFMSGFVGPLASGATVVHQRALRPELILDTMRTERITHMALVPLVLTAFERALKDRLREAPPWKQALVGVLGAVNESLTQRRPNHALSKTLLRPIHDAFGGHLKMLFCGGAFVDRRRAELFYRLGLPVAIGYGLTEACTVATVNDLKPFRADSVGRAVPGVELRIDGEDEHGVGQVLIRGRTLMSGYLDDPELTRETLQGGWLHTGDLGFLDASQHLHLVGRSRNMIVTEGGKNVYPEDIEGAFDGLPCDELAVYAANYIWPKASLTGEELVAVVRTVDARGLNALLPRLRERNRRLPDFKRLSGVVPWDDAFPRTASMKVKRSVLAGELRERLDRGAIHTL